MGKIKPIVFYFQESSKTGNTSRKLLKPSVEVVRLMGHVYSTPPKMWCNIFLTNPDLFSPEGRGFVNRSAGLLCVLM